MPSWTSWNHGLYEYKKDIKELCDDCVSLSKLVGKSEATITKHRESLEPLEPMLELLESNLFEMED